MAVVNKYVDTVSDGSLPRNPIDPHFLGGGVVAIGGTVELASGDSSTSTVTIAVGVPSHWRPIKGLLTFQHDAITALTGLDIGDASNPDGLADGLNVSTAGAKDPFFSVGAADVGKPLWEILGYTEATKPETIDIIATLMTNASSAGTLTPVLIFSAG